MYLIGEPRKLGFITNGLVNTHIAALNHAWKKGEYAGRLAARLREIDIVLHFGGNVYPDIPWTTSILDHKHTGPYFADKFAELCKNGSSLEKQIYGEQTSIWKIALGNSAIIFSIMKALAKSDTAAWFSIAEDLAYSLLSTRLNGVVASDVTVPFHGFYIELPRGLLQLHEKRLGFHDLRVISVSEGIPVQPSQEYLELSGNKGLDYWKDSEGRRLSIVSFGEVNENSFDCRDDSFRYETLPLCEDSLPIETIQQNIFEAMERDGVTQSPLYGSNESVAGKVAGVVVDQEQMKNAIFSFVINLLLYLGSKEVDIVSAEKPVLRQLRKRKKSSVVRRRIKEIESQPDFVVGSRIVLNPTVRQTMQASAAVGGISKAVNVLVRGHWRHVWHGKKTEESPKGEGRRPVWVQPFVRNKATGAVLGHQYEVR